MDMYTATEEAYKKGYEAGEKAALEQIECLKAKLEYVNSDYNAMQIEFARMRAQLDIVYLIFGGK